MLGLSPAADEPPRAARRVDRAAAVAHYGRLRRADQIDNGWMRYELSRQRSLDFSQASIVSWANIAKMGQKLGLALWDEGLGEGHSVKARSRSAPLALRRSCEPSRFRRPRRKT